MRSVIIPPQPETAPLITFDEIETFVREAPSTTRFYTHDTHPHLYCVVAKALAHKYPDSHCVVGGQFWVRDFEPSQGMPEDVVALVSAADEWWKQHRCAMRRFEALHVIERVKKQLALPAE